MKMGKKLDKSKIYLPKDVHGGFYAKIDLVEKENAKYLILQLLAKH